MITHVHKYQRRWLGQSRIYKCMLSGCNHFIQAGLAEGRLCICDRCGRDFTITKRTLKNCPAKPHCDACYSKSYKEKTLDAILETLIVE